MRDETTPEAAGQPTRGAGRSPFRGLSRWLLLASALVLCVSLALPTVFFQAIGGPEEVYSIFGGVRSLWGDGNRVSAVVVFVFSILFPAAKLAYLGAAGVGACGSHRRETHAGLHRLLVIVGKWSFVDVFIIALFVGSFLSSPLASSSSRSGILLFAFAIFLSMVGAHLAAHVAGVRPTLRPPRATSWFRLRGILSAASLVLLFLGARAAFYRIQAPGLLSLLKVTRTETALASMTNDLASGAEGPLALAVGLLVILTPLLRGVVGTLLALVRRASLRRLANRLDEWAMLDVFALALFLVHDKLAELTDASLLPGAWILVAAACVAELDALLIRLDEEPIRGSGPSSA